MFSSASTCCSLPGSDSNVTDKREKPRAFCLLVGRQFALVFFCWVVRSNAVVAVAMPCCTCAHNTRQQITLLFYMEGFFLGFVLQSRWWEELVALWAPRLSLSSGSKMHLQQILYLTIVYQNYIRA